MSVVNDIPDAQLDWIPPAGSGAGTRPPLISGTGHPWQQLQRGFGDLESKPSVP